MLDIAQSGGMKLFMVDYHLERARPCEAMKDSGGAAAHYRKAQELINETGYKRRQKEIPKEWTGG